MRMNTVDFFLDDINSEQSGHLHKIKMLYQPSFLNGFDYRIVAKTSPSCFEAHAAIFRLLMKEIFDPYVL